MLINLYNNNLFDFNFLYNFGLAMAFMYFIFEHNFKISLFKLHVNKYSNIKTSI